MDHLKDRVAVVSGASSGMGADFAKQLALKGLIVVGLDIRKEMVEKLAKEVGNKGKIHSIKCNVADDKQVSEAFEWVDNNLGGITVLINNAGLSRAVNFEGRGDPTGWKEMLDVNVYGLSLCTRHGVQNMLKHKIDDGHIININSVFGHDLVTSEYKDMSMYFASKYAVTVLTDALRKELVLLKSNIRVTSISPGNVKTEFLVAMADPNREASKYYPTVPHLVPEHITQAVIYILSAPPIVNISELTIKATGEKII